jgi:hypothetical protein
VHSKDRSSGPGGRTLLGGTGLLTTRNIFGGSRLPLAEGSIRTRLAPRLVTSSNDQAIPARPPMSSDTGPAPAVLSHLAA